MATQMADPIVTATPVMRIHATTPLASLAALRYAWKLAEEQLSARMIEPVLMHVPRVSNSATGVRDAAVSIAEEGPYMSTMPRHPVIAKTESTDARAKFPRDRFIHAGITNKVTHMIVTEN